MFQKIKNGRHGHAQEKSLMNLCSVASFTEIKLATKSDKDSKTFTNAHVVCSMYYFKRTSEKTDTLSNGFHQSVQEIKNEFLGFRDNNTGRKLEVKIF